MPALGGSGVGWLPPGPGVVCINEPLLLDAEKSAPRVRCVCGGSCGPFPAAFLCYFHHSVFLAVCLNGNRTSPCARTNHQMLGYDTCLGMTCAGPVTVTAYSYFFGTVIMAAAAGVSAAINQDLSAFLLTDQALEALAFAVVVRCRVPISSHFFSSHCLLLILYAFCPDVRFANSFLSFFFFLRFLDHSCHCTF